MKDLNNAKKFKGIDRFITFNVQEKPFSLPTPSGIRSSPPSPAGSFRGASSLYCPGGCADTPVSPCKHGGAPLLQVRFTRTLSHSPVQRRVLSSQDGVQPPHLGPPTSEAFWGSARREAGPTPLLGQNLTAPATGKAKHPGTQPDEAQWIFLGRGRWAGASRITASGFFTDLSTVAKKPPNFSLTHCHISFVAGIILSTDSCGK